MTERGYITAGAATGAATLNANTGDATEITITDEQIVAVAITSSIACRIAAAALGTAAAGAGKTAVTSGASYFRVPADTPVEIPVVGAKARSESLYLISDDTNAGTFSYLYIRGGER